MTTATIALNAFAFIDFSWMNGFKDWVLGLVRDYPTWAAAVVFILAFAESLAFVSLLFPAWGILFLGVGPALGAAGTTSYHFLLIASAAAVGAALGDWLSYWLGYHYHTYVQHMWPLRNHPHLIEQGKVFFKKWGAWAIVIARFLGPLRASVPIVAGISEMPWLTFQLANWLSAFVWAVGLLALGKYGMQWLIQWLSLGTG
jgi:membrane protein DedA with SNARE-associated domain